MNEPIHYIEITFTAKATMRVYKKDKTREKILKSTVNRLKNIRRLTETIIMTDITPTYARFEDSKNKYHKINLNPPEKRRFFRFWRKRDAE